MTRRSRRIAADVSADYYASAEFVPGVFWLPCRAGDVLAKRTSQVAGIRERVLRTGGVVRGRLQISASR